MQLHCVKSYWLIQKMQKKHESLLLAVTHIKLDKSIEMFYTMDDVEKNAMFRAIYMIIGKDYSEYKK